MELTPTTRELILSKIERIDEEIESINKTIETNKTCHFVDSWLIDIDLLKRNKAILKKAIIDNIYNED